MDCKWIKKKSEGLLLIIIENRVGIKDKNYKNNNKGIIITLLNNLSDCQLINSKNKVTYVIL
jgi:hypothetical protein